MAKPIMTQIIDSGKCEPRLFRRLFTPIDKDIADAFGLERLRERLSLKLVKGSPADKAGLNKEISSLNITMARSNPLALSAMRSL